MNDESVECRKAPSAALCRNYAIAVGVRASRPFDTEPARASSGRAIRTDEVGDQHYDFRGDRGIRDFLVCNCSFPQTSRRQQNPGTG
ncbi:hypothetical protein D3C84_1132360 [compost metagenome]